MPGADMTSYDLITKKDEDSKKMYLGSPNIHYLLPLKRPSVPHISSLLLCSCHPPTHRQVDHSICPKKMSTLYGYGEQRECEYPGVIELNSHVARLT